MDRTKVTQTFQVGFTYIGTVVGAGFASGREILSFFSVFGEHAYAGIVVSTCLFAWVGIRILLLGSRLKANSYRQLTAFLLGGRLAKLVDLFMLIMLFGVTVAMLAGVRALFDENLKLPFQLGVLVTMALAYLTIRRGMRGLLAANSVIVPMMITLICVIFIKSAGSDPGSVPPNLYQEAVGGFSFDWLASAVSYAAFNLGLAVAVLAPLGNEVRDKHTLTAGAIIGACGLGAMLVGAHYSMSLHMPDIQRFEVPIAFITSGYGWLLKIAFLIVLWGEIFSTLIANVYGISSQLAADKPHAYTSTGVLAILAAAFLISQVGFSNIVAYLYPVFGYLSFLLLLLLIWPRQVVHD